jgi:heparan-alpha-glucosaminide N-acetyltransferase
MVNPINTLKNQRIISIDAFRGITFFLMIIVNELAGVSGISAWLKHMPANADAMSLPDMVFPAFLFIVGMSIPFGINHRIAKGESVLKLNAHILLRALALIVMGVFMVNAEDGNHHASMPISIQAWALLSYLAFMLIWGVYQFKSAIVNRLLVSVGVAILIVLAFIYRGGSDGSHGMSSHWWGILGLIGWAYMLSCWIYQLCRGKKVVLLCALAACIGFYALVRSSPLKEMGGIMNIFIFLDAHIAHSAIVICGILSSLIFFEENPHIRQSQAFLRAMYLTLGLLLIASVLRPLFSISKIYASPSWGLYSAAVCILIFAWLYWVIDLKRIQGWIWVIRPAAINPLVCYLLPFVIESLLSLCGVRSPIHLFEGGAGIVVAVIYAGLIMIAVAALNRINFKLKF